MENSTFDLVRQILRSPAFLVQTVDQQQATLDQIVATGEITREDLFDLINQEVISSGHEQNKEHLPKEEIEKLAFNLEGFDYNTFLNIVINGDLYGPDLIALCNSSKKLSGYCNKAFQSVNKQGIPYGEEQDQWLFRVLLDRMRVRIPNGKLPRQLYMEKTVGGRVSTFGGEGKFGELGMEWNYKEELYIKNIPLLNPDLQHIIQVSSGSNFSLCLDSQRRVWVFGDNTFGELGLSQRSNQFTPILNPNLNNIIQVSAGGRHSLCLDANGKVWGFGSNQSGQLGLGDEGLTKRPVLNPSLNNIIQISTGHSYSLCLDNQGKVFSFGSNITGQLGLGDRNNRKIPILIPGLNGIIQISCGEAQSACLDNQGRIWEFGGHLGPIPLLNEYLSNIIQVSCGNGHTLCLDDQGQVWSYGLNDYGQLGLGENNGAQDIPIIIPSLNNIVQVEAGDNSSFFIDNRGQVWVFGNNQDGQLGLGNDQPLLVTTPTLNQNLNNIIQVSFTDTHTICIGL